MKVASLALLVVLSVERWHSQVEGFVVPAGISTTLRSSSRYAAGDMGEYDHLLGEKTSNFVSNISGDTPRPARSVLRVPDGSGLVTLTSSVAADPSAAGEQFYDAVQDSTTLDLDDPFAADGTVNSEGVTNDPRVNELISKQQQQKSVGFSPMKYVEGKDFTDLFFTIFLPLGLAAYGAKWALGRSSSYLTDTADFKLDDFANEMVYHDGDMEEMEMCYKSYTKKLGWLGPNKKGRMINAYLEAFAKKVAVSPRSIR